MARDLLFTPNVLKRAHSWLLVLPLLAWKQLRRGKGATVTVPPSLAPSSLRIGASACVVVAGLYWFLTRALS